MKKWTSISTLIGFLVFLLSAAALFAWYAHVPNNILFKVSFINNYFIHSIVIIVLLGMAILGWKTFRKLQQIIHSERTLKLTNSRLQESENRFRLAFHNAAIGMVLFYPDGRLLKVNPALCECLNYTEEELLEMSLESIIYSEDYQRDKKAVKKMLQDQESTLQSEQRWRKKNGETVWILVSLSLVKDEKDRPLYFIAQLQNVTSEKNIKEELKKMAYHDPLTGLSNRNRFDALVQQIIGSARRRRIKFALIMLDLDHFKVINDSLGHDAGDELLKIVANRLKSVVRSTDLIARLGGDEFILVVTDIHELEEVGVIAQKVSSVLTQPITYKGQSLYATTSIGISVYPNDGDSIDALLKSADLALYRAKEKGRNNYQFCTPEMTSKAHEKMAKQKAITAALARDEFKVYYQPKLELSTGKIIGVEALIRWDNKLYSSVPPDEIISLAEETGVIFLLGQWILDTAIRQVKEWQLTGFKTLNLSINLSPKQFKQPDIVNEMMKVITKNDFSPKCIQLEVTENLILQDPEATLSKLMAIKEVGMEISIDDFGTGYSSLSYLKSFNVDQIKIDKSFIRRLEKDDTAKVIVSTLLTMANKLEIKTIAEGVETKAQYEFLLKENCTEVQGYYLSPPLPAESVQPFLKGYVEKSTTS